MFKRVSLVWKREDLTAEEFAAIWLGDHARQAVQLVGLREYVVDLVDSPALGSPDGIATLRFDSREACEAAFAMAEVTEILMSTRDDFAARTVVLHVDERIVHQDGGASWPTPS